MPETGPRLSPAEISQKERLQILAFLGPDFEICWTVLQETGMFDFNNLPDKFLSIKGKNTSFNEKAFYKSIESVKKIKPAYLEHLQEAIKQTVEESDKQTSSIKRNEQLSILANQFIIDLEFFSRLCEKEAKQKKERPAKTAIGTIKTPQEYTAKIEEKNYRIGGYAPELLNSEKFKEDLEKQTPETIKLVYLQVKDLFHNDKEKKEYYTYDEIKQKARELSLQLLPPEVGPALRLEYTNQPMNEWVSIGMEPIELPDGRRHVFNLGRNSDDVWLGDYWARPADLWSPEGGLVFGVLSQQVNT